MKRVRGLDAIRFVCALIVTISHLGFPPILGELTHGELRRVDHVLNSLINGQAAVMVFFVISGFCIHFPFRDGKRPEVWAFYARRMVRVGLPLAVITVFCSINGGDLMGGVLWSLIAEMIYYIIYPLLLVCRRRVGWPILIVGAYAAAATVIVIVNPRADIFPSFGPGLNWIVGLPCWLLGCLLAERYTAIETPSILKMWFYRGAIVFAAWIVTMLRFNLYPVTIGCPWSLNVFALGAYLWLGQEIAYHLTHAPSARLERCGRWSYSLYLLHPTASRVAILALAATNFVAPKSLEELIGIVASLVAASAYYRCVEWPSHRLAIVAGRWTAFRHASGGVQNFGSVPTVLPEAAALSAREDA